MFGEVYEFWDIQSIYADYLWMFKKNDYSYMKFILGKYDLLKKIKLDIFFGEGNYMQYLYVIVESEHHK